MLPALKTTKSMKFGVSPTERLTFSIRNCLG